MMKIFYAMLISLLVCSVMVMAAGDVTVKLINQDPDPASAGDILEIRLGIENKGAESVENLAVEVVPEYPFEILPGEDAKQEIGTIRSYQSGEDIGIVKFKLRIDRDANAGQYELKIFNYEADKLSGKITKTVIIDIKNKESAEVIYIDQVQLLPGKITPMTFTINNVGSAPLRDLVFFWENEEGVILPVGSDDTKYIKRIEVGESEELVYDVIASVNADPDLYKLKLTLTYDGALSGDETVIATSAGVYVGGQTDFDIAYSGSAKGETSFSIANIGSVPANSVTVSVPRQGEWRVSGSDSVIIGNLNKGDYTIASFSLQTQRAKEGISDTERQQFKEQFQENGPKDRALPDEITGSASQVDVQIAYTDTRGERHVVTKEVRVDLAALNRASQQQFSGHPGAARQQDQGTSKLKWTGLVLSGLFALLVMRRWYGGRKRRDPKFKLLKWVLGTQ